ncbi:MAG: glycosyltransferase [Pseudomonadota bacterium]
MNIVHLELGRYRYGGAEQVRYLLEQLAQSDAGAAHTLVTARGSDLHQWAKDVGQRVIALRFSGEHDLAMVARLIRVLRNERARLLHVHSRRGADWMGPLAAWRAGIPALLSRRVDHVPGRWLRWLMRHRYQRTVAISQTIHDVLAASAVPEESLMTIQSAVDVEALAAIDRDHAHQRLSDILGQTTTGPVIGVVAQLIERKGHRFLFEALPALVQRHPDLRVVCFGQGGLERELRTQVTQGGLSRYVRFAGFLPDLDTVLPALTLVVHPALREGLGVSLLKAAAVGVPVIGFRAGGVAEVVVHEHTGLLVEPGSVPALTASIAHLLENDAQRLRFSDNARQHALQHFGVAEMVARHRALYDVLKQESV